MGEWKRKGGSRGWWWLTCEFREKLGLGLDWRWGYFGINIIVKRILKTKVLLSGCGEKCGYIEIFWVQIEAPLKLGASKCKPFRS